MDGNDVFALDGLADEQRRVAALKPPRWAPPPTMLVAGVFLAFERGEQGPGRAGDRGWVGAVVMDDEHRVVSCCLVRHRAGAPYVAGLLAAREGGGLLAAVRGLDVRPDVVLVDATGRDHPRRAGLAVHLGALADVPTVGVTHRPLLARGDEPSRGRGASSPLLLDGEVVGAWLRTLPGTRPLAVHAAWRTDVPTAVEVVRRSLDWTRTPAPLREARRLARVARSGTERELRHLLDRPVAGGRPGRA